MRFHILPPIIRIREAPDSKEENIQNYRVQKYRQLLWANRLPPGLMGGVFRRFAPVDGILPLNGSKNMSSIFVGGVFWRPAVYDAALPHCNL